ncbi:MAG: ComF family protein [Candidatus Margulisiibacteriota bacterium]|jgi:ComF family protein
MNFYNLATLFLDLLFPPRCFGCREILPLFEQGDHLCPACRVQITCLNEFRTLNGRPCFCITLYAGLIRKLIWQLKFRKRRDRQKLLASIVLNDFPESFQDCDVMIPVPLSKQRSKERGFNQAELLLRDLATALNKPLALELVLRVKDTRHMYKLHEWERLEEITGAFELSTGAEAIIRGKNVLLFDDIITTGKTVNEIATLLEGAGVKKVYILGLAKTKH